MVKISMLYLLFFELFSALSYKILFLLGLCHSKTGFLLFCLYVCLSVCLFIFLFVCLSFCLSVSVSVFLFVSVSTLSVCVYLSISFNFVCLLYLFVQCMYVDWEKEK